MRRQQAMVAAAFMLGVAGSGQASAQNEGKLRLLCKSDDSRIARVVDVDFGARTINGSAATIAETHMTWTSIQWDGLQRRDVIYDYAVNRLTGVYEAWGRGIQYASPGPVIRCSKAPEPKF